MNKPTMSLWGAAKDPTELYDAKNCLVSHAVAPAKIIAVGMGSMRPMTDNKTAENLSEPPPGRNRHQVL